MNPIKEKSITCICCPIGCDLIVTTTDSGHVVSGNKCPRGKKYGIDEVTNPKRVITSTVKIKGGLYPVIPVKTLDPVPKEKIFTVMKILASVEAVAPVKLGDVIVTNIAGTGVDIIATKDIASN